MVPEDTAERRGADRRPILFVIVGYLVAALAALMVRSPLGHDESVYALRARDLSGGWSSLSGYYWADYRAPGLSVLLSAASQVVGLHVTTSRAVVTVTGGIVILATWLIGTRLGAPSWAAALAGALTAASSGFLFSATALLADVPGAAFALLAVAVYVAEVDRPSLRWSLVAVPLLTFAATTIRFGAPFTIAAGLAAAFAVAAPGIIRDRRWVALAQSAVLAAATALVVVLVLLTDLLSILPGGVSPADANRTLTDGKGLTPATGFTDLWKVVNPWSGFGSQLWSGVVAVVVALGIGLAVVGSATDHRIRRVSVFAGIAGTISLVGVTASVGLVVNNYLALSLPYWTLLAGAGFWWVSTRLGVERRSAPVALAAIAVCVVALLVSSATTARSIHDRQTASFTSLRAVATATPELLGEDCAVVTSYTPQVGYYSECYVSPYFGRTRGSIEAIMRDSIARALEYADDPTGTGIGVVVVENGKRQPAAEQFETSEVFGEPLVEAGEPGRSRRFVQLLPLEPCLLDEAC